jgi:hypothetical protein
MRARVLVLLVVIGLARTVGCRTATEITIDIRTLSPALRCADLRRVAIVVTDTPDSAEEKLDTGFVSAEVNGACDGDDRVGTLVITPSDSSKSGAVIIAASLDTSAKCTKSGGYKGGCIVARRAFSFVDHSNAHLPITLERSCLDVPCDVKTSCRAGECLSSDTSCSGSECTSQAEPTGGESPDGAPTDGGKETGGGDDGGKDAPADAPFDVDPDAFGNTCPGLGKDCDPSTCCYMAVYFCSAGCAAYSFGCVGRKHCDPTEYCCGLAFSVASAPHTQCDTTHGQMCSQEGSHYICTSNADCPPDRPTCVGIYYDGSSSNGGFIKQCQ